MRILQTMQMAATDAEMTLDLQTPETAEEAMGYLQELWSSFIEWGKQFLPKLAMAVVVFILLWWLSKVAANAVEKMMKKRTAETALVSFTKAVLLGVFRILTILFAIMLLGFDVSGIVAAIAAAGVTVGLALRDSLSNLASGIIIVINRTFRIGDYLQIADAAGTVQKIEFMNTRLKTGDGREIIIPNSKLTSNHIINHSSGNIIMLCFNYRVGYESDIKLAKEILLKIVESNELVLKDPKYTIEITSHNEDGVGIEIKIWCKKENQNILTKELEYKANLAFMEAGITSPKI